MKRDFFESMARALLFASATLLLPSCEKDGDGEDGGPTYIQPEGTACVSFYVDDSANATYSNGQIQWKGSLQYDEETNVITYDVNWGEQLDYPIYPALYDDGPIAGGGHEMRGGVAGDGIFSVEVYVYPEEEERTYYFGATNEFGYWIWEGPNGEFTVSFEDADGDSCIDAGGMTIHEFGDRDLLITLDTNGLHEDYSETVLDKVFLKGSMNSWTPVQLLDNGEGEDEVPQDGVYTYLQSLHLGPHDGMLYVGQHVQFVFVFNFTDGLEYKISEGGFQKAASEGVLAWSDAWEKGSLEPEAVVWELDSWGSTYNTTVIIGDDETTGDEPVIDYISPASGSTDGGDEVFIYGANFANSATARFDVAQATSTTFVDSGTLIAITPAHSAGTVDVTVTNPDGLSDTLEDCFTYIDESINLVDWAGNVDPASVTAMAGEESEFIYVDIYEAGVTEAAGAGAGVTVRIGYGTDGSDPSTNSSWSWSTATYSMDSGNNDVYRGTLTIGTEGVYDFAFRVSLDAGANWVYVDAGSEGTSDGYSTSDAGSIAVVSGTSMVLTGAYPDNGLAAGGTTVTLSGANLSGVLSVTFGGSDADFTVESSTEITAITPAGSTGDADITVSDGSSSYTLADGFRYTGTSSAIDWGDLQWPSATSTTAGTPTENIYGQVYEDGVTPGTGPGSGIVAELGYGPSGTDPMVNPGWFFFAATYNTDHGNNDEYAGTLTVETPGTYSYTFRYSIDGGYNYLYTDFDPGTGDGYDPDDLGVLTVY